MLNFQTITVGESRKLSDLVPVRLLEAPRFLTGFFQEPEEMLWDKKTVFQLWNVEFLKSRVILTE